MQISQKQMKIKDYLVSVPIQHSKSLEQDCKVGAFYNLMYLHFLFLLSK